VYTSFKSIIAFVVIFILSAVNLAQAEDTVWTTAVDGWRVIKRPDSRSCLAATTNNARQVLGIQLFADGTKTLSLYNVKANKGEPYSLRFIASDGSSKKVSGIAPADNWIILEVDTDFLVGLVSVGTLVFPDIGNFDGRNSKEAVLAAMHCLETIV
jgi:hypothetical protein